MIFSKKAERLNLCAPGGKETTRMLKAPRGELGTSPPVPAAKTPDKPTPTPAAATAAPECSHEHPAEALFLSRARLNKPGSKKETWHKETWHKETWHIEFDLAGADIDYSVGDAKRMAKESGRYQQDVY